MGRARTPRTPAAEADAKVKADAAQAEADAKAKADAAQAEADAKAKADAAEADAKAKADAAEAEGSPELTSGGAIEVRAGRPSYRRAGFVFGDREWTRIERNEELTAERLLALIDDPVLSVRGVAENGEVVPFTGSDRAMFAQAIRDVVSAD